MKMQWHGDKALAALRAGEKAGLQAGAEVVFEASQREVPIETGRLKASGKIRVKGNRATISYGEGLPDQRAGIVHEKLELDHPHGSAKFLENPTVASAGKVFKAIADGIRRKLT
jgi:hypothetical protein